MRYFSLVCGLFLFALAIVLQLESKLGLSPWDTLHQGIAIHTPLSFGEASIVVGVLVMALAWKLGARVGVGTVANAVLVGAFIEALIAIPQVDGLSDQPLGWRIAMLAVSMPLIGIATAFYLGAWLGAGPRDSLMVVGAYGLKKRLGVVRAMIEITALAIGFALGGTVGVGTVVFALTVGPAVEAGFWSVRRAGLATVA